MTAPGDTPGTRWRGLKDLVQAAVEQGSRAVERVQKDTAGRPFAVLEAIPAIADAARVVHVVHDASVAGVHAAIRLVTRIVGATLDGVLDVVEPRDGEPPPDEVPPGE